MTLLELTEEAAPPLRNGELDFEAPWQGRVFALANSLSASGVFAWREFQAALIEELRDVIVDEGRPYAYYEHFLHALTDLLASKGVISLRELEHLTGHLAEREHGHDHGHHHRDQSG